MFFNGKKDYSRNRYEQLRKGFPDRIILLEDDHGLLWAYDESAEFLHKQLGCELKHNRKGKAVLSFSKFVLEDRLEPLVVTAWAVKSDRQKSKEKKVTAKEPETDIPTYVPEPGPEESCDNCQLRKSGACSQLRNALCADYRAIPYIPQDIKDGWPENGDVSAIRAGEKRYFR